MLLDRDSERAILTGLLDRVRAGQGGALIVRGDPGIGKSALIADLVERRGGLRLLSTSGVEAESPLAFAALQRMLLPVLSGAGQLPEPQSQALARAFGSAVGSASDDRFLVFLAALTLMSEAAGDDGLLCVIDDAQWLDEASLAALLFVARRIEYSPVAMVFAVRDGEARTVQIPDIPELRLHGLTPEAAEALLEQSGRGLDAHLRNDLVSRTGGNPLALLEIPSALSDAQLAGEARLPDHLPLTDNVERVFANRARALSAPAQQLLLLAAIDDSGDAAVVTAAARRLALGDDAADEVARSGLMEMRGRLLTLRHPLVRSAVYSTATPGERRRAHRALAEAFDENHDPDRSVWHLAAAAETPDDLAADRLVDAAHRFRERGGHEAAALAFERAAELTSAAESVGTLLTQAADAAWGSGDPVRTRQLAHRARAVAHDVASLADLDRLRALVEMNFGSPRLAHGILAGAVGEAQDAGDTAKARQLAMVATALGCFGADSGAPIDAERLAEHAGESAFDAAFSSLLLGLHHLGQGRLEQATPELRRGLAVEGAEHIPDLLPNAGIASLLLGDDELSLSWHDRQLDVARRQSSVLGVLHALTRGAMADLVIGRWRDLEVANAEALDLARAIGHENQRILPLAQLLVVDAYRGGNDIPERADEIEALLRAHPCGVLEDTCLDALRWARGIHAARTAPEVALHHFDALVLDATRRAAAIDIADAAARANDRDALQQVAENLGGFESATGNRWAAAAAEHAHALLAPESERETHFLTALEHHTASLRQFARARTELALGEHLRRVRRRVDAREHLRAASVIFDDLGATPWLDRATEELRASGEVSRWRAEPSEAASSPLTAQELQVARLVQDGLSNKEVAARLFLSPRTVEFHLRNVFGKLGITSRTGLAAVELGSAG